VEPNSLLFLIRKTEGHKNTCTHTTYFDLKKKI
jgi:hypothetical protein